MSAFRLKILGIGTALIAVVLISFLSTSRIKKEAEVLPSYVAFKEDNHLYLKEIPKLKEIPDFFPTYHPLLKFQNDEQGMAKKKSPYDTQEEHCKKIAPYLQRYLEPYLVVFGTDKFNYDPAKKMFSYTVEKRTPLTQTYRRRSDSSSFWRDELHITNYNKLADTDFEFPLATGLNKKDAARLNGDGEERDSIQNFYDENDIYDLNYSKIGLIYIVQLTYPFHEYSWYTNTSASKYSSHPIPVSDWPVRSVDISTIHGNLVAAWAYNIESKKVLDRLEVGKEENLLSPVSYNECNVSTKKPIADIDSVPSEALKIKGGNWLTKTEISPIDGSTNEYVYLLARDGFFLPNELPKIPALYIRCKEGKTELFVDWDTFVSTYPVPVLHRLDQEKAETKKWSVSSNYRATFMESPIPFIKQMLNHDNLLLRVTPHGENPATVNFRIQGLRDVIDPLQAACGWN